MYFYAQIDGMQISEHEYFIPVSDKDQLYLKRFQSSQCKGVVFMVHGSVENGRVFYSSSGKGIAPFLATHGFDVFVVDLRGKGKSFPAVDKNAKYGQYEAITEDIPACIDFIKKTTGREKLHLMAHSWGGVLCLSWFARYHGQAQIQCMVFFGTKRKIYIKSWEKRWKVDLFWNIVGTTVSEIKGYLPAKSLRFGSDNESKQFYKETNQWVYSNDWIDQRDGLNYPQALKKLNVPPIMSLTGVLDTVLGNPYDVQFLLQEANAHDHRYVEVGKKYGFKHDYGHIDILTHPEAPQDHFPLVLEWLNAHNQ